MGLDAAARDMLWSTLRQVVAQGTAVVLTTHYLEEAEALAHRVAVLAKGKLIAQGSVDEVRSVVDRKRVRCLDDGADRGGAALAGRDDRRNQGRPAGSGGHRRRRRREAAVPRRRPTRDLEVQRAGLAEAFAELTREAA